MTTWLVELRQGLLQKFLDLHTLSGRYYKLKSEFFTKLQTRISQQEKYHVHYDVIRSVKGPPQQKLIAPFILSLTTRTGLTVTFLGDYSQKNDSYLLGLWPAQFQEVLNTDPEAIVNLLYIVVERPEAIHSVQLLW